MPDHPEQPDPFEILGLDPEPVPPRAAAPTSDPSVGGESGWADADGLDAVDEPDDGDYVALPASAGRGGGRRWGLALLGLLVVMVLVVGAGAVWVKGQVDPGSPGEPVALTIPAGSTTSEIASLLADKGIITNATVFEWWLKFNGGGTFQAGDYDGLRLNSSMSEVKKVLDAGPVPPKPVSFLVREGLWESETRQLILDTFPGMDPAALDAALANTHPPLQPDGLVRPRGLPVPGHLRGAAEPALRPAGADRPDDGRLRPHVAGHRPGRRHRHAEG